MKLISRVKEKYPNILAEINFTEIKKWIYCKRNGVPGEDGGNDRWFGPLFIDQDVIPTFVE
ncbi:MAG: hypothetical protein ACLRPW_00550 [Intestinibacter sp.]